MRIVPLVDEGLGNSSYLVALGDGGALVVDPQRDPAPYLAGLEQCGLRPRFVVETHLHADFVSGGRELAAAGATLVAPARSELAFDHRPVFDGEEVDLGGLTLRAIGAPGHTPEHLAYLLVDDARPLALFSGGTLIAGGVARTDLLGPEHTDALARAAYRSVRSLFTLPDDLPVYPTHGAGSFCSTGAVGERTTTIGRERRSNPLFSDDLDEDAFVARLLSGYSSYPPYFLELRAVNRSGPRVYGPGRPQLAVLTPDELERAVAEGAELVDVRGVEAFAEQHVPGALSIPWRAQFATWLGWLVGRDRSLVFVVDPGVDRAELVWACRNIGYEHLLGELDGGMQSWNATGRPTAAVPIIEAPKVLRRRVVDVRQRHEFDAGHARGAENIELGALPRRTDELLDAPVLVHCGHGERAMTAASILERTGHRDVEVLRGGPQELAAAGRNVERTS